MLISWFFCYYPRDSIANWGLGLYQPMKEVDPPEDLIFGRD